MQETENSADKCAESIDGNGRNILPRERKTFILQGKLRKCCIYNLRVSWLIRVRISLPLLKKSGRCQIFLLYALLF